MRRCCGGHARIARHPVDPQRLGHVLERLFAQVVEGDFEPPPGLAIGVVGEADAAGLRQALQACRNVDAVAVDVVALDDHVAQVDADAESQLPVPRAHARLPGERAADGIHHRGELYQESVAHELYDAPPVLVDQGFEERAANLGQAPKRTCLIGAHEGRVASHVGGEYGGKPAFQVKSPSPRRLMSQERRIHIIGTVLEWQLWRISDATRGLPVRPLYPRSKT